MNRIRRILGVLVVFVLYKIVFGHHLHIRVIGIDVNGPAESHGHGSIPSEQRPPDSFP